MLYIYLFLLLILTLVIIIGTFVLFLVLIGITKTEVPFLPVPTKLLPEIEKVLNLTESALVYDLGCGNGQVLRYLLKHHQNMKAVGIEIAPLPYYLAKMWNMLSPLPNLKIIRGNFMKLPVADATHIFLYLFPKVMDNLLPKLKSELKPGTRVVSCDFIFADKKPLEIIALKRTKFSHTLYVYEF